MTTIETFIEGIAGEPQPLLSGTSGKLLFEIRDRDATNHRLFEVDKGVVAMRTGDHTTEADATVTGERALIDDIAQGRANAMTAMLRGDLVVEGNAELLVLFSRLFPGPDDPQP